MIPAGSTQRPPGSDPIVDEILAHPERHADLVGVHVLAAEVRHLRGILHDIHRILRKENIA